MWQLILILALREVPGRHIEVAYPVAGVYATLAECEAERDRSYTINTIPPRFQPRGRATWTQAVVGICERVPLVS